MPESKDIINSLAEDGSSEDNWVKGANERTNCFWRCEALARRIRKAIRKALGCVDFNLIIDIEKLLNDIEERWSAAERKDIASWCKDVVFYNGNPMSVDIRNRLFLLSSTKKSKSKINTEEFVSWLEMKVSREVAAKALNDNES